jgi:dihydrofolate reductase
MSTMSRPRTSGFVGVSLDGFLARPDGAIDWLEPYEGVEHGYRAFFDSIDSIVMGRKTYEFVLGMVASGGPWPYAGKRCVVMTHRALDGRNNERAFAGEPAALLQELYAEGARHVYIDGGVVVRTFLSLGLLDELTISVVPSLIGAGLPLFGGVKLESGVKLEHATSYSNGVVQMRYRMRGP